MSLNDNIEQTLKLFPELDTAIYRYCRNSSGREEKKRSTLRKILKPALITIAAGALAASIILPRCKSSQPPVTPPPILCTVANSAFFDYNGDGIQESGEPNIEGIELEYKPGNYTCITDKDGKGVVNIPAGSYRLSIDNPGKFRYFLPSISEVIKIEDGLSENITENETVAVPLAEGFLTWPFPSNTKYTRNDYLGRDSVFDEDSGVGFVRAYNPSIPTVSSGGLWVADNHFGIDIGVKTGTKFIATADLKITDYQRVPGQNGKTVGLIWVLYNIQSENQFIGYYAHSVLMDGIKIGDVIKRGQPFGMVEDSDTGASHLHFQIQRLQQPIDSYRDITNSSAVSYWTKDNDPQYSR